MSDFVPHTFLKAPHPMTVYAYYRPRSGLPGALPTEARLFAVSPESRILAHCHWQAARSKHPALILVHGLEGSSDSHYVVGIAGKAWRAGFNVIRLNQRTCGGTEALTPTLYNSGLSGDVDAVLQELSARDGIESVWLAGYSMGGNLILRLAGQVGEARPMLKGLVAVCPSLDPAACVAALEKKVNWVYHQYFVRSMQARLRRKALLFPGKFDLSGLALARTLRAIDDLYTAPDGGYEDAADYYEQTGARHVLHAIRVPTFIITAQDDPLIPFESFNLPALAGNSQITLVAPRHGGHCGFIQRRRPDEDIYWAENRLLEFIVGYGSGNGISP